MFTYQVSCGLKKKEILSNFFNAVFYLLFKLNIIFMVVLLIGANTGLFIEWY